MRKNGMNISSFSSFLPQGSIEVKMSFEKDDHGDMLEDFDLCKFLYTMHVIDYTLLQELLDVINK